MSRRRRKPKQLPRAVTERRPFLSGFADVILGDGSIVVMPAAVTTIASKRFADHVFALIPKTGWTAFYFGESVHAAPKQKAFLDALMKVWPRSEELDPELERVAMDLLHEFIKMVTTRAPGAIAQAFASQGIVFEPVPS